ncbi:MAG: diguanylate cyclase [Betaproteobacteria bacterium]|nr:diguanylate cyclase [Betaproteobacteria bacterium]
MGAHKSCPGFHAQGQQCSVWSHWRCRKHDIGMAGVRSKAVRRASFYLNIIPHQSIFAPRAYDDRDAIDMYAPFRWMGQWIRNTFMSMKCPPQLRAAADTRLAHSPVGEVSGRSDTELVHELQAHENELKMLNEALIESHIALEESRERFVDFYEFAPVGYLTVTDKGLIAHINLTGAALLGVKRSDILSHPFARFVKPEDADRWHLHFVGALTTDEKRTCELALLRWDGSHIHVRLDSLRLIKDGHAPALRVVLTDISDRKRLGEDVFPDGAERDAGRPGLGQVLGGSAVAMFVLDRDHRVVFWNRACENLTGVSAASVLGTRDQWRAFYPDERPVMADLILMGGSEKRVGQYYPEKWQHSKVIEGAYEAEDFFPDLGKGGRWVFFTAAPLHDQDGQLVGAIETLQDVTERKRMEAQLRIAAIVFEAQEGTVITDVSGVILRINSAFTRITGYTADEAVGQTMRLLHSGRHPPVFYSAMWASIAHSGSWQGEIWNRRKNGEIYPEWLSITAVEGVAGDVSHYVGIFTDITGRKAVEDETKHRAFYDALTDLPNRILLNDRLQQALVAAKRSENRVALMFLDLDNFKPVNDFFGHDVGDQLLKAASRRILTCLRESDTVARIGGDEFIVLLRTVTDAQHAKDVADKIRLALCQPFELDGHRLSISSSIGIALYPEHGDNGTELSRNADVAMYQAKKAGRNTVEMFAPDPKMDDVEESRPGNQSIVRLNWITAYASGEQTIDREHRELFRLANILLETALMRDAEPGRFDSAVDALLAQLVKHFAHEEAILQGCGYQGVAEHAAQHRSLLASALKLRRRTGEAGVSVDELVGFLVSEVVAGHLLKADPSCFGPFVDGTGDGNDG